MERVRVHLFFTFLSLFSSSLGDPGQGLTATVPTVKYVQDAFNSISASMEKLEERIDEVVCSYMGREIQELTEQVQRLKAENQKILQIQRELEANIVLIPGKPSVHLKNIHCTEMLTTPRARLFSGVNFTASEDYSFETASFTGGCHELKKLGNNVTSVDTFGKCVRLFEDSWCEQPSVAIYPGSEIAYNVLKPNTDKHNAHGATSVKLCDKHVAGQH